MFRNHLIEGATLHYGEFINDLSKVIVSAVYFCIFDRSLYLFDKNIQPVNKNVAAASDESAVSNTYCDLATQPSPFRATSDPVLFRAAQ